MPGYNARYPRNTLTTMYSPDQDYAPSRLKALLWRLRLDPILVAGLLALLVLSSLILFSASDQNNAVVLRQITRFAFAFTVMFAIARLGTHTLYLWTPTLYVLSLLLLLAVLVFGASGKGAQRWLDLGLIRFQPSELMKLAMPMMMAFFFAERRMPPSMRDIAMAFALVLIPTFLIYKQPDLGTALLVASSGLVVIFLAGLRWRTLLLIVATFAASAPVLWHFMHDYQRRRILTFIKPESDPLGAGYHILQSKIALGSGGFYGRGWLQGTQSQLNFLPEQTTDFIFSVYGEEFGLLGVLTLFSVYLLLVLRGFYIAWNAQDSYGRLLAASISMTFFIYFFVNVGMVSGLLPVVGVPLPLISYGGSSMVTLMAGFGILMAIQSERRLLTK